MIIINNNNIFNNSDNNTNITNNIDNNATLNNIFNTSNISYQSNNFSNFDNVYVQNNNSFNNLNTFNNTTSNIDIYNTYPNYNNPNYYNPNYYNNKTKSTINKHNLFAILSIVCSAIYLIFHFAIPLFFTFNKTTYNPNNYKYSRIHKEIKEELEPINHSSSYTSGSSTTYGSASDYESLIKLIYNNLLQGKTDMTITYTNPQISLLKQKFDDSKFLYEDVYSIDDETTSSDFDYMSINTGGYEYEMKGYAGNVVIRFKALSYETPQKTAYVDAYVEELIDKLDLYNLDSDYDKIKKVHDYIIAITDYNHDFADAMDLFENHDISRSDLYAPKSAYNLIVQNSTVCTGYSLLYYKILTELGIDCRIVTSETHAWNIVKLNDKWYHIDLTWDDSDYSILTKKYFLKGSNSINDKEHTLQDKFLTSTFASLCPISKTDY